MYLQLHCVNAGLGLQLALVLESGGFVGLVACLRAKWLVYTICLCNELIEHNSRHIEKNPHPIS
jgi:hypothetical protein